MKITAAAREFDRVGERPGAAFLKTAKELTAFTLAAGGSRRILVEGEGAIGEIREALSYGVGRIVLDIERFQAMAVDDDATTPEDTEVTIDVLANDQGIEEGDADRLLIGLESESTQEGRIRVALTGSDLGSPLFAHMFGQARIGGE